MVQRELVRCYLKALAAGDAEQMSAVVPPPEIWGAHVQPATFTRSRDAREGRTRAVIVPNEVDGADATVKLTFATGRRTEIEIQASGSSGWRVAGDDFTPGDAPPADDPTAP